MLTHRATELEACNIVFIPFAKGSRSLLGSADWESLKLIRLGSSHARLTISLLRAQLSDDLLVSSGIANLVIRRVGEAVR